MTEQHTLNGWSCLGKYMGQIDDLFLLKPPDGISLNSYIGGEFEHAKRRVYQDEVDAFNGGRAELIDGVAHVYAWKPYGYRITKQLKDNTVTFEAIGHDGSGCKY